jgi:hypothetical protein
MIDYSSDRRTLIKTALAVGLLSVARGTMGEMQAGWSETTASGVKRIIDALRRAGEPLPTADEARILQLLSRDMKSSVAELTRTLDRYTVARVTLDAHGVGGAAPGGCDFQLRELGWRTFLVRVDNPSKLTGPLTLSGRRVIPEGDLQSSLHDPRVLGNDERKVVKFSPDLDYDLGREPTEWLGFRFGLATLPRDGLEGASVEYQLLQLYSQLGGRNSASLAISLASVPAARRPTGRTFTQSFISAPASFVTLRIEDSDRKGTTASLLITDSVGRIYPAPAHRIEPDLGYQWHIYRADGESIRLPAGHYRIAYRRGPEYLEGERELTVPDGGKPAEFSVMLERWIDPPGLGWYPGEPHIHAEGQEFANVSKLGLTPESVIRQVRGEALSVGSVLIWTDGYYYEKQFLTGHVYEPTYRLPFPGVQQANNTSLQPVPTSHDRQTLLRYDVEQAAFPSNRLGHPILLRLRTHDFPGAPGVYDWPSWNLPILQWAKQQGALCGYAHCGLFMSVDSVDLPNYEIPELDGVGANECLVDITHGVVDFMAGGESVPVADLNVWYHLLNCGFLVPMVGETDFPVGSGTRIMGTVRTYAGLDKAPEGDAGYDAWTQAIGAGRLYFGDGRSHLIDLTVNGRPIGTGPLILRKAGRVTISVKVAARLQETPSDPQSNPQTIGFAEWDIERARIGNSRRVPLEVISNSGIVERREILADGVLRPVSMTVAVHQSSWIVLRILPSVHSAPILVHVGENPVRASRRSAEWCLACIELLWKRHSWRIRETERSAAEEAWNHARDTYRTIASECNDP